MAPTVAPLCALLLMGCGDSLVGGEYHGEALLTLTGEVLVDEGLGDVEGEPRVALYWAGPFEVGRDRVQSAQAETDFPAYYTIEVYTPAPDIGLDNDVGAMAIGLPLLYLETTGDDLLDPATEVVIGSTSDVAVLYVTESVPGPNGEPPLDLGYQPVTGLHRSCDAREAPNPTDADGIDIVLGEPIELVFDTNCDGQLSEWGPILDPPD